MDNSIDVIEVADFYYLLLSSSFLLLCGGFSVFGVLFVGGWSAVLQDWRYAVD